MDVTSVKFWLFQQFGAPISSQTLKHGETTLIDPFSLSDISQLDQAKTNLVHLSVAGGESAWVEYVAQRRADEESVSRAIGGRGGGEDDDA